MWKPAEQSQWTAIFFDQIKVLSTPSVIRRMFRLPVAKNLFSGARRFSSTVKDTDVVVVSFARTPITKMGGALSSMTAPQVQYYIA